LQQEEIEKQLQRRWGRQVLSPPFLDLENSNDNASLSKFDDYVGNFDRNVNDKGFKLIMKKLNKTMMKHKRTIWFK
jgi:hypothetical protein